MLCVRSWKQKYQAGVLSVNCEQLRRDDVTRIMEKVLYEFPIVQMEFFIPKWVEILPTDHYLKAELLSCIRELMGKMKYVKDATRDKNGSEIPVCAKSGTGGPGSFHRQGEDTGGHG